MSVNRNIGRFPVEFSVFLQICDCQWIGWRLETLGALLRAVELQAVVGGEAMAVYRARRMVRPIVRMLNKKAEPATRTITIALANAILEHDMTFFSQCVTDSFACYWGWSEARMLNGTYIRRQ